MNRWQMTNWQMVRSILGWLVIGFANRVIFHQDDPDRVFICDAISKSARFHDRLQEELKTRGIRSS